MNCSLVRERKCNNGSLAHTHTHTDTNCADVQSKSRRRRANAVCSIKVIMKVDKGVCTSNDAYFAGNTTTNELNSIIKFETVFTTLVENKILAIKRECEEHENKKKARSLKKCFKKDAAIDVSDVVGGDGAVDGENDRKKRKNFFTKYYKKQKHNIQEEVDVERGEEKPATASDGDELMNVVVILSENNNEDHEQGLRSDAKLDSQISNDLELDNAEANLPLSSSTKLNAAECDKQNCDKLIIDSRETNAQVTLSTTNNHSNVISQSRKQQQTQQQSINYDNDESLATTIDISLQQSSVVVVATACAKPLTTAIVPINNNVNVNNHNNNNRSDVAICDDGASSQNTSDIEFSLNSENNSVSELPRSSAKCKSVVNSDPVIKKFVNVVSPPLTRGGEKKACERKAISCQSTPIFGRHKHVRSESEGKKVLTFQKEQSKSVSKGTDAIKSHQTIVIAPTSTTTTTTLAKTVTTTTAAASIPLETVHASKKKHSTKIRDVSVEYEITYDNEERNQSPHGFISSFNQLTSQKQSAAIISANIKKQASTTKDHQRRKSQDVDRVDVTTKRDVSRDIELDELDVEVVNKKKKKKRRSEFFFVELFLG